MQDHAPLALAGDAADVTLTGLDVSALRSGAVLCHPDFPVRLAAKFTAQVLVLQVAVPILKGQAVTVHAHTAREAGVVSGLLGLCDAKSGAAKPHRPRCLLSGQVRAARQAAERVLCALQLHDAPAVRAALPCASRCVCCARQASPPELRQSADCPRPASADSAGGGDAGAAAAAGGVWRVQAAGARGAARGRPHGRGGRRHGHHGVMPYVAPPAAGCGMLVAGVLVCTGGAACNCGSAARVRRGVLVGARACAAGHALRSGGACNVCT